MKTIIEKYLPEICKFDPEIKTKVIQILCGYEADLVRLFKKQMNELHVYGKIKEDELIKRRDVFKILRKHLK